ncbi:MAG TPA: tetratricopeptide repeat protein, partial [Pirellulales bacterium]|nr:tetratricopeptide repeat protein [Pirellulales bacterium]
MEADRQQQPESPPPAWYRRLASGLRSGIGMAAEKGSRRARIAILVGALMVGANLALVLTWLNVKPKAEPQTKKDYLAAALEALDRGNYADAKRLAALTRDQRGASAAESSGSRFVLGAATAMEADSMWDEDQRRYYLLAARHLEEARRGGFSKEREGQGMFLLGKSLCLSREYTASQSILERALETDPAESQEIHRLLARAYLWGTHPDLKLALAHNDLYLADKQLSRREQFEGLLIKGQILFKDGKIDECLNVLKEIPKDAPSYADATVLQGQLLMRAAEKLKAAAGDAPSAEARRAVQDKYSEAIDTLRKAQNRGNSAERIVPQSMYLIGQCFLAMNDSRSALDQFRRTQQGYPESIEGIAAAFQEADLLLRRSDQDDEAIAAYRRAVAAVGDPAEFRNPLLSLDNIRQRLSDAYQTYVKAGRFERAIQLTGVLVPLFTREQQVELAAQAHQAWAAALTHEVDRSSTVD